MNNTFADGDYWQRSAVDMKDYDEGAREIELDELDREHLYRLILALESQARKLEEGIATARESLPNDKPSLNEPWSECIAILDELSYELRAALTSEETPE